VTPPASTDTMASRKASLRESPTRIAQRRARAKAEGNEVGGGALAGSFIR
jgi:hypothetical protein